MGPADPSQYATSPLLPAQVAMDSNLETDQAGTEFEVGGYTTVGVVGHIDHGKTTLVAKLTGVDTDSHPEEKARGITIDIGFAACTSGEHTLAFIDAPGHQKYIGNLLAGVSRVDIGLLVVAADQGIQEQSLEHVAILKCLSVPRLVVAISRIDLCTEEQLDALVEELEVFLGDYGYHDFPVVPYSAHSGEGVDQLLAALKSKVSQLVAQSNHVDLPFRMPIDRVLSVEGRGLVVAGTPWTGRVSVGSTLQLAGTSTEFRVRDLEIHGTKSEYSQCGRRTAVNLVGSHSRSLRRGDELVEVGSHTPSQRFVLGLELAPRTPRLKLPLVAQLHTATRAVACRLLGPKHLDVTSGVQVGSDPSRVVVVEVDGPIVGTVGQSCILRLPYPVGSIGGGRILASLSDAALAETRTRDIIEFGERLQAAQTATPSDTLIAWAQLLGELHPTESWWASEAGQLADTLHDSIAQSVQQGFVQIGELLVSAERLQKVQKRIVTILKGQAEQQENAWLKMESLIAACQRVASSKVIEYCLKQMSSTPEAAIVEMNGLVAIASEQTQLSKKQRARMVELIRVFEGNRTPPNAKELAAKLAISQDATMSLLRHAAQQRILVELEDGLCMHAEVFEAFVEELRVAFGACDTLGVPEIKEMWGVTRKHAIPLLEYCDRTDLTARVDDGRVAGDSL